MEKLLITAFAFAAVTAAPASAAPVYYGAPVAVPLAYNWTGLYVGGNIGYSTTIRNSSSVHLLDQNGVEQMQTLFSLTPSGWVGGGQIGFNWELVPHFVVGLEGDWDWSNQKDSVCGVAGMGCVFPPTPPNNGVSFLDQKYDWISTLRARVGYAQDGWLIYVTGGGAWAKVETNLAINCPTGCGNLVNTAVGAVSFTDRKSGWVAGLGIEVMLWRNWLVRLEYLHFDFGSLSQTLAVDAVPPPGMPPPFTFVTLNQQLRDNMVRIGLNYKFGYTPAYAPPIVTK
jgi:outer membrane immunogenic protein